MEQETKAMESLQIVMSFIKPLHILLGKLAVLLHANHGSSAGLQSVILLQF